MKKSVLLLVGLILVGSLGCMNLEETMVINADGSATSEIYFSFDTSYLKQMKQMAGKYGEDIPDNPYADMFDKKTIKAQLDSLGKDIKMIRYDSGSTDESVYYRMKFSLADLNDLPDVYEAVFPEEDDEYTDASVEVKEVVLFSKQDNGTWLFKRPMEDVANQEDEDVMYPEDDPGNDQSEEYDDDGSGEDYNELEQSLEDMADSLDNYAENMGENYKILFKVTFPRAIIESNATSIDGKTATWEYKMSEMTNGMEDLYAIVK